MFKQAILSLLAIICFVLLYSCNSDDKIDYSTQVKPIINAKCISCHGGVKKQGGFSLLFEEEALAVLDSGKKGIVPGSSSRSEMIRRLTLEDPEERMPYQKEALSQNEIDILTQWVEEGAEWGAHWAYQSIQQPKIPDDTLKWGANPIDQFIGQNLRRNDLQASDRAQPEALARRLSLDLIGMPAQKITKQFIENPTDAKYENLVDRLLDSKHFGERWASMWLDIARYADTKGYEKDQYREIWRYRDWLIKAFNKDMPYDQFITEQLAGDLLENPTDDQFIATAFHRNTMTNDEGGTDNEEFRTAAVLDRVNTTWEGLLSTSFACVQCHSHPFDPFRHDEYYQFSAFFNNSRDEDTLDDYPKLRHYNPEQQLKFNELIQWLDGKVSEQEQSEITRFIKTLSPAQNSLTTNDFKNAALGDTKFLIFRNHAHARLQNVELTGKSSLIYKFQVFIEGGTILLRLDQPDGKIIGKIACNEKTGWSWVHAEIDLQKTEGIHDIYFTYEHPRLIENDININHIKFDWMYFTKTFPGSGHEHYETKKQDYWDLFTAKVSGTPVMIENPKSLVRSTHMFVRGNWLDKGKEVQAGTPETMNPFPDNVAADRLALAQWIVDPQNPLASRTIVNRIWAQLFGTGLVETLEDMGTQGASPSNQALLDYLSWTLMNDQQWRLKSLIKSLVMSETYRQSSETKSEHLSKDPNNKYLARMPRVRLSAEQIRDQALVTSGTLNEEMFGPPVMPYQPDGIWKAPYDGSRWQQSTDDQQYRRAIYTYWKRTSPYPSMVTFDGVGREVCVSRRIKTNTPLQALVTLNDRVYIDLSKKLAENVWRNYANKSDRISAAYKSVVGKTISSEKFETLAHLYQVAVDKYNTDPALTKQICEGTQLDNATSNQINDPDFAALILVSNAIINLDEVINKT